VAKSDNTQRKSAAGTSTIDGGSDSAVEDTAPDAVGSAADGDRPSTGADTETDGDRPSAEADPDTDTGTDASARADADDIGADAAPGPSGDARPDGPDDPGDEPATATMSGGASEEAVVDAPPESRAEHGSASSASSTPSTPRGVPTVAVKATKSSRKAHLTVSRVEPWSVMKFSFVIALVCFIILFVAIGVIYAILSSLGVFDAVTELFSSLTDGGEGDDLGINPAEWFSPARVLGYTGLIGALNIILITALSTVGAMLYNLAADLVGGVDVTLTESE
jgi:cobalamin biosynthesis Mg chelatase CobN